MAVKSWSFHTVSDGKSNDCHLWKEQITTLRRLKTIKKGKGRPHHLIIRGLVLIIIRALTEIGGNDFFLSISLSRTCK